MSRYDYVRIKLDIIPDEIVAQYSLDNIAKYGWVYMEIQKGMPGLRNAGKISHDRLVKHLAKYGYAPVRHMPAFWKHKTRPVSFTLCVDDFGMKFIESGSPF